MLNFSEEQIKRHSYVLRVINKLVDAGKLPKNITSNDIITELVLSNEEPEEFFKRHNLLLVSNPSKLDELIDIQFKENPKIVEDAKNGKPNALYSLVGKIRKIDLSIDPKQIKERLEEKVGIKIPEKVKKEVVVHKDDVWREKETGNIVKRCISMSEEKLTDKLRPYEFFENCFGTMYRCECQEFSNRFEKIDSPMVYKKLINKTTKEEIKKVKEKFNEIYIYVDPNKTAKLLTINKNEVEEI